MTQLWWNSNSTCRATYWMHIPSFKVISHSMLKKSPENSDGRTDRWTSPRHNTSVFSPMVILENTCPYHLRWPSPLKKTPTLTHWGEWIYNITLHFIMDVINYPRLNQKIIHASEPCHVLKGAPGRPDRQHLKLSQTAGPLTRCSHDRAALKTAFVHNMPWNMHIVLLYFVLLWSTK